MTSDTKKNLVTFALIGAAATPIALVGGELLAALFCITSTLVVGLSRKRV